MGELVDLKEYRALKAEQEAEREMDEVLATVNELEMLKRILSDIARDLPDAQTSILYVPIEPKPDVFMNKSLDGYLDDLGLTQGDENGNDEDS
tara:strand:+ start:1086 stop:1364 length:279 start_codon:yes stop_codon:yes gene_type:complete